MKEKLCDPPKRINKYAPAPKRRGYTDVVFNVLLIF